MHRVSISFTFFCFLTIVMTYFCYKLCQWLRWTCTVQPPPSPPLLSVPICMSEHIYAPLNCQLISLCMRKMIKIVATGCYILRLKCTKFDFNWGSALDPAGGARSASPDPLAGF